MFSWTYDPIRRLYDSLFPFSRDLTLPYISTPSMFENRHISLLDQQSLQEIYRLTNPTTPDEIAAAREFHRMPPEQKTYALSRCSWDLLAHMPRELSILLYDDVVNPDDLSFKKSFEESLPERQSRIIQSLLSETKDRWSYPR